MNLRIIHGDSLVMLKRLKDNSVDAVVTDPPYGLSFIGKQWDYEVPTRELWEQVIRVLKPGGHLLSFGGTRTYHRMVVNIEAAGFEIRDQIMWIYGSGFPKSMNVSIAIDKQSKVMGHRGRSIPTAGRGERVDLQDAPSGWTEPNEHRPITDDAKQWQGWGTALKPANEPIVLARKPLSESTVAKNVLRWGTGALNIDESRIATSDNLNGGAYSKTDRENLFFNGLDANAGDYVQPEGRWPANVLFDEEAAAMLDEQSGKGKSIQAKRGDGIGKGFHGSDAVFNTVRGHQDSGGASRFFYVAKTSKRERNAGLEGMPERSTTDSHCMTGLPDLRMRNEQSRHGNQNHHPTVKPIKLMEYLCKLITPPGGIVLDPFMGSGTTGVAAKSLRFKFIGIEKEKEYVTIARRRINACRSSTTNPRVRVVRNSKVRSGSPPISHRV